MGLNSQPGPAGGVSSSVFLILSFCTSDTFSKWGLICSPSEEQWVQKLFLNDLCSKIPSIRTHNSLDRVHPQRAEIHILAWVVLCKEAQPQKGLCLLLELLKNLKWMQEYTSRWLLRKICFLILLPRRTVFSNMLSIRSESLGHQIPPRVLSSEKCLLFLLSCFHTFPLLLPSPRPFLLSLWPLSWIPPH